MNNLFFLNHASFAVERDKEILLIDPWYEGTAFNNGWALLDKSTTNSSVIEWLQTSKKKIYIWYSHEHSDHLSISFLKLIKKKKIDLTIIFQKTLDGRVSAFFKNLEFNVLEANNGQPIEVGINFTITTWSYRGGDSFWRGVRYQTHQIQPCVPVFASPPCGGLFDHHLRGKRHRAAFRS